MCQIYLIPRPLIPKIHLSIIYSSIHCHTVSIAEYNTAYTNILYVSLDIKVNMSTFLEFMTDRKTDKENNQPTDKSTYWRFCYYYCWHDCSYNEYFVLTNMLHPEIYKETVHQFLRCFMIFQKLFTIYSSILETICSAKIF